MPRHYARLDDLDISLEFVRVDSSKRGNHSIIGLLVGGAIRAVKSKKRLDSKQQERSNGPTLGG